MTNTRRARRFALTVAGLFFLSITIVSARILMLRGAYPVVTAPLGAFAGPQGAQTYAGAVHVHTTVSADARVPLDEVVAAARAAGASFLVLTEHDTLHPLGARARYQDGVLLVAAIEWSTSDGHLLDLSTTPERGPFRTGDEALAACRRTGGPCVAAHPTSWRRQWLAGWTALDGMEIHSAMSGVGDLLAPPFLELGWTAWQTLLNPPMGLFAVGAAQERALWMHEAHVQQQPMSTWCSPDLHGHLPLVANLQGFLTLVSTPAPLSEDALVAAQQLMDALPRGTCVNALAGWVDGLQLESQGTAVRVQARMRSPAGAARVVLLKDASIIQEAPLSAEGTTLSVPATHGTYRAEIRVLAPGFFAARERPAAVSVLRVEDIAAP